MADVAISRTASASTPGQISEVALQDLQQQLQKRPTHEAASASSGAASASTHGGVWAAAPKQHQQRQQPVFESMQDHALPDPVLSGSFEQA